MPVVSYAMCEYIRLFWSNEKGGNDEGFERFVWGNIVVVGNFRKNIGRISHTRI